MLSFAEGRDPMAVLAETPERLIHLVSNTTGEVRRRRPAPGKWSINEIAAHVADCEIVVAWRLRTILVSDGVALQPFDQDAWASRFNYQATDAVSSAKEFAAYRSGTLAVLRRIDPALFSNHGMHAERGRETVSHIVHFYAGHDINHLRQIERILGEP